MQIQLIAFLLSVQSFVACQQVQEKALPLAASLEVNAFAASPQEPKKKESTTSGLVFQSADGGKTWLDISAGLPEKMEVFGLFADGGEVILGHKNGLFRGKTNASASPVWQNSRLLNCRVGGIYPGRAGLYVNDYGGPFFQQMTGTSVWLPVFPQLNDQIIRTLLETADGSILVGTDNGIFKSADLGKTWKHAHSEGMVLHIVEADGVLICAGEKGVMRSSDGGEKWESVFYEHIFHLKTGRIAGRFFTILGTEDPTKPTPGGVTHRLRVSADGGKTWQRMEPQLLPMQGLFDMDKSLADALDIYDLEQAGESLFGSFDTGIFRSDDLGKTWKLVRATDGETVWSITVSDGVVYAIKSFKGC